MNWGAFFMADNKLAKLAAIASGAMAFGIMGYAYLVSCYLIPAPAWVTKIIALHH